MSTLNNTKLVKGYCPQCKAVCPTIAQVENGIFTRVLPDEEHPNAWRPLCPKGLAGPEMVYSKVRLRFPMRRTKPKGDSAPGWERISWDEALDTIATRLNEIKSEFGAEAVAFYRPAPAGSPSKDFWDWMLRLAHAFGSPNTLATTHICNWAKDVASAYTYGTGIPEPEMDKSACILIWGFNPYHTWPTFAANMEQGIKNGAKLIVIDPRRTEVVEKADLWLQVHPGTDGALALSLLNVMITEDIYDRKFVLNWTNGPFLVQSDTKNLLKANDIVAGADAESCAVWDEISHSPKAYDPRTMAFEADAVSPALTGIYTVSLADGKQVECKTSFQLLTDLVSQYPPERAEEITKVPSDKIRQAAKMFATIKPASYYTWNGIEQQANTSQTNRAICLLYALTGNFDAVGSNRIYPKPPLNRVAGTEFLMPEAQRKRLGSTERPLGPPGMMTRLKTMQAIRANDFYEAVLNGRPYPAKGLVAFGGNIITANPESLVGREAIRQLDFFVQVELFMTPAAELADIVLPAASYWESWHVRSGFFLTAKNNCHIQLREAVVPPQHESKPDMEIIFELACKLGLGDKFWGGDIEAAFNYQLSPTGLTVADLRTQPGGITLDITSIEKAYSRDDAQTGLPVGFNTPCKRVEIFSQLFRECGYEPLPVYKEPMVSDASREELLDMYPLTLTNFKFLEYCHGWGRCLPLLRRMVPEPFVEINPVKAGELGIKDGEVVIIETPNGKIKVKAQLTDRVSPDVVCTQHGWWQECRELGLPGYDPYSPEGRNVNLLYSIRAWDPVIGTFQMKGYPCAIRKV